jgi:acetoin utilization deacetylase AcuC-like enzyme
VAAPLLLAHPSSGDHDPGPHPEDPERIVAILRAIEGQGGLGWRREDSPAADHTALEAVHSHGYLDAMEALCAAGGGAVDADTYASRGTWEAALHGAGGAIRMVDALLDGEAPVGFSAHRPPGHHAEAGRAMGFCFLNHVAIAARHALDARGLSRVLVLDWDVHHGNGTNDIFATTAEVLFVSIHESPLYPGSGPAGDVGRGAGEGYTVNLPVPGGSGDGAWCSLVEHVVAPLALEYRPQLVLVSAGFDAHAADPLATCRVSEDGFAAMAGSVRRLAAALSVPVGAVLEGGYAIEALASSVVRTLAVLGGPDPPPADPDLPVHALARAAGGRLARHWPAFSAL